MEINVRLFAADKRIQRLLFLGERVNIGSFGTHKKTFITGHCNAIVILLSAVRMQPSIINKSKLNQVGTK